MSTNSKATGTILAVVVTLAVAGTGGYMLGARLSQPEAQTVITVNNDKITKTQMYDRMVKEYGSQVADSMIQEKLVDQEAKKANITITQADQDAELTKLKASVGGDEGLNQALAQNNMTMDQLKDKIDYQLKVTRILTPQIPVDDNALMAYFTAHVTDFDKRQVHAQHILVATEQEAKDIKAQLVAGAKFEDLAKAKSTDTSNKDKGGDLGFFPKGQMDPAFEKAAFSMKPGEISDPVQSQFGWHIIKVVETKGDAPTFENSKAAVKDAVVQSGVSDKYSEWLQGLQDKAKIDNSFAPKK